MGTGQADEREIGARSSVLWRRPTPPQNAVEAAESLLRRSFGETGDGVWAAPGRVSLIGEHVDYNGGLCLPYALPHCTVVAARLRNDGRVRCVSSIEPDAWECTVDGLRPGEIAGWAAYVAGALWSLGQAGVEISGLDLAIESAVPVGAGLSSSAALICAVTIAVADLCGVGIAEVTDRTFLAGVAIRAETEFAGAPTGGMDQIAALQCTPGHVLLLDCLDSSWEPLPLEPLVAGLSLLVIDTRAPHRNVAGSYGRRRRECEDAARLLGVEALREIDDLPGALASLTSDALRRRVRHVVTEIQRARQTAELLRRESLSDAGAILTASHVSLRDDFEVSAPPLDIAVTAAMAGGALGARLVGGGFGGSVLALVRVSDVEGVATAVDKAFTAARLARPQFLLATPSAAARRLT